MLHFTRLSSHIEQVLQVKNFLYKALNRQQIEVFLDAHRRLMAQWKAKEKKDIWCIEKERLKLCLLLCDLLETETQDSAADPGNALVENSIKLFMEQMSENPSLSEISDQLGYNVSHLRRAFHRHCGLSPKEYFESLRMNEALFYIKEKKHSLSEISHLLGYQSLSNFSRVFKRRFGQSPRHYHHQSGTPQTN